MMPAALPDPRRPRHLTGSAVANACFCFKSAARRSGSPPAGCPVGDKGKAASRSEQPAAERAGRRDQPQLWLLVDAYTGHGARAAAYLSPAALSSLGIGDVWSGGCVCGHLVAIERQRRRSVTRRAARRAEREALDRRRAGASC